mgnify:CR=1 FL=1
MAYLRHVIFQTKSTLYPKMQFSTFAITIVFNWNSRRKTCLIKLSNMCHVIETHKLHVMCNHSFQVGNSGRIWLEIMFKVGNSCQIWPKIMFKVGNSDRIWLEIMFKVGNSGRIWLEIMLKVGNIDRIWPEIMFKVCNSGRILSEIMFKLSIHDVLPFGNCLGEK